MKFKSLIAVSFVLVFGSSVSIAGVLNPDCDVSKVAKGAAAKATVGVGGRCSPTDAAKDMSKKAVGIEDKGMMEKKLGKDEGLTKKATKKVLD